MSMELWVLSDRKLGSIAEWQSAIDAEGFPLKLSNERPFEKLNGFLPAQLLGKRTGFECDHFPAEEVMREASDIDLGREWKFVLAFRWGGDFNELQAAWMAATAYAVATDGVVLDDQEARVRTAAEARQAVDDIVRGMPELEQMLRELKRS